jgi:acid stress-induced BolA-like protein IbaG/YrbA
MSLLAPAGAQPHTLTDAIGDAIREAIPGAEVEVAGAGGHFAIRVTSEAFRGLGLLAKQRLVMAALTPFMRGDAAPVHAIDRLETLLPGDA